MVKGATRCFESCWHRQRPWIEWLFSGLRWIHWGETVSGAHAFRLGGELGIYDTASGKDSTYFIE